MRTLLSVILAVILFTGCQNSGKKAGTSGEGSQKLTAAGATFPLPFYNMVFKNYTKETNIQVTYGGVGSGGGIRSLKDQIVDFGATDAFLTDEQQKEMPAEIVHIPTCIGAVVIAYNLPGVNDLNLSNTLLEKIFLGEVTKWNDPLLKKDNPDANLPDQVITVVTRSDGSGTTHIFSDFMSKISEKWANQVGTGKSLKWPTGMGAKGNPGVAGTISQTPGTIGYIGSEYAFAQKIQTARVQNSNGEYILPDLASISAAAKGNIPDDTRVMLTNSADPASYPISGFTWIILYKEQAYKNRTREQAQATVKLLDWLMSEKAQGEAAKVHYAPLPPDAVAKAKAVLRSITYHGEALLTE
jgi:phosphate transport system substrate-binding protein